MNEKKRKEKKKDIVFPYNEDIGCEVQAYLDELEGTQRARVCVGREGGLKASLGVILIPQTQTCCRVRAIVFFIVFLSCIF